MYGGGTSEHLQVLQVQVQSSPEWEFGWMDQQWWCVQEDSQILYWRLPLPLSPSVPAGLTKWFTELKASLPRVWSLLSQWGTGDQTNNNKLLSIMAVRLICLTQFYWGRRAGFSPQTSQNPMWACSGIHAYQEWNLSLRKGFVSEWEGCCKYFITPQL